MKQYEIKSSIFDRPRKLILAENYVEFENRDLRGQEFSRLNKGDIADFKHGMDWIVWYKFYVGLQFLITFKNYANKELRILFRSSFGLNRNYTQVYSDIVDDVWKFYHQDIVNEYLDRIYKNEEITLQGIKINLAGIQLRGVKTYLPWEKIEVKEFYRYFAIVDKENPQHHSRISYNEYETETLWSTIKSILKAKQEN